MSVGEISDLDPFDPDDHAQLLFIAQRALERANEANAEPVARDAYDRTRAASKSMDRACDNVPTEMLASVLRGDEERVTGGEI